MARKILDKSKRLSDSSIWPMLEQRYASMGVSAWDRIPFYLTSNPFIAEVYADLILSILKDYQSQLDTNHPVYVLELGAGTGCFSFYLLRELDARRKHFSWLNQLKIVYILTDSFPGTIQECVRHPKLNPFVQKGLLDFACFRPEKEDGLQTWGQKIELRASTCVNPLFVIANYVFDSMRQDLFRVDQGQLHEVRHTFFYDDGKASPDQRIQFSALQKTESAVEITSDYYQKPVIDAVLGACANLYMDATILFPIGALSCLQNLLQLSGGNLALLSSDRGFTSPKFMEGIRPVSFNIHDRVFSYTVNYHAVAEFFRYHGGIALLTPHHRWIATMAGVCLRHA